MITREETEIRLEGWECERLKFVLRFVINSYTLISCSELEAQVLEILKVDIPTRSWIHFFSINRVKVNFYQTASLNFCFLKGMLLYPVLSFLFYFFFLPFAFIKSSDIFRTRLQTLVEMIYVSHMRNQ